MTAETNQIYAHIKRILSPKEVYRADYKINSLPPHRYEPPIFVTDDKRLFTALERADLKAVLLEDRTYVTIREGLAQALEEFKDPRAVLLGIPPLRWGKDIETFNPYADVDEDGYIEMAISSLPANKTLIFNHLARASRLSGLLEDYQIAVVSQDSSNQVLDTLHAQSINVSHLFDISDYARIKDLDVLIQVSDGLDRIHGDASRWIVHNGVVLSGPDFYNQITRGYRFTNYPVVFSEACKCGKYNGMLTKCFIFALSLYIGNSMSTTNNIIPDYWYKLLCGDGFKYGMIDKLDEGLSIFQMYKEVINRQIEHAGVKDKKILKEILQNKKKVLKSEAIQILTFNMYGVDKPNPVKIVKRPYDIGIVGVDTFYGPVDQTRMIEYLTSQEQKETTLRHRKS